MTERRRVNRQLMQAVRFAMREYSFRAMQALTSASPVRFGSFRAGWSMSVGAPVAGLGEPPRDPAVASAQAATLFRAHSQEARAIRASYEVDQGTIFIVNPIVYGPVLNAGSSEQAPEMFVEEALATARMATRDALNARLKRLAAARRRRRKN